MFFFFATLIVSSLSIGCADAENCAQCKIFKGESFGCLTCLNNFDLA